MFVLASFLYNYNWVRAFIIFVRPLFHSMIWLLLLSISLWNDTFQKNKRWLIVDRIFFYLKKNSWLKAYGCHSLTKFLARISSSLFEPFNFIETHKLFTKIEMKYGIRITKIQKQFDTSHKIESLANRSHKRAQRNRNKLKEKRENNQNCILKTWNKNVAMIFILQIGLDYIFEVIFRKTFVFISIWWDQRPKHQQPKVLWIFLLLLLLLFFGSIYSHEWVMGFLCVFGQEIKSISRNA